MKRMFLSILACSLFLLGAAPGALAQQKERTPEEIASQEAERLETLLGLEGWQVFYVDSILQNNYSHMQAELYGLRDSKVENVDLYVSVRDKWNQLTYDAFSKVFNEDQWNRYLKSGAGKEMKLRQKRAAKAK
ncbi:MAG: hypothetical protein PUB91_03435 [Bacteroidales bacterium]|nr:hypothetical protein [Bacteroidales bacterium]